VVWHFYHVIFDPDVYPLNWACWNGKVSRHWQAEEHPLEISGSREMVTATNNKQGKAPQELETTAHSSKERRLSLSRSSALNALTRLPIISTRVMTPSRLRS